MKYNKQLQFKKNLISGFTLLEVLIALAVVSIAIIPMVITPISVSTNQSTLKAKTFAEYVALNKIAELHLERNFPPLGTKKGTELMAGREWFWESKIVKANSLFKNIRRIELTVSDSDDDDARVLSKMVSLVGNPK